MTKSTQKNPAPGYEKRPDHRVDVERHEAAVTVRDGDTVLARSGRALRLEETGYEPVFYFPREDVAMDKLMPFARRTYCPFKGDASYWALGEDGTEEPVAWSYDAPYDEAMAIEGHIAFYADRVDIEQG
jgi:uncharacterized protein (DUF427 family)